MPKNPADRVVRTRVRETLHFPDLSERLTLRLAAVERYVARAHFAPWHRILGLPDFAGFTGVFSPLTFVELAVCDVPCVLGGRLAVVGESGLARTLGPDGATRHIVRDGRHEVRRLDGATVARARLVNTFTRYDPDPAQRRVTALPEALGLGPGPSRLTTAPGLWDLVPRDRPPDRVDPAVHAWHLGSTDANRHVNGMEYLRACESWVADVVHALGHDLRVLAAVRARIVYRKPCFRGDGYRRVAWLRGESPLVVVAAIVKTDDPPDAPPAVAVELTWEGQAAEPPA